MQLRLPVLDLSSSQAYNRVYLIMRGKLILLTILFVLFVGFVTLRFFVLDTGAVEGQLRVNSSPAASVFLDNVALGKTPYEGKVKAGEHEIKLIPLGDATATASFAHKVSVEKNTLSYVNVELGASDISTAAEIFSVARMAQRPQDKNTGEIEVETDPAGGIVSLDNEEKGTAALILSEVARGNHELSISLPTFFPRTQKINVEPGYRIRAFFKLALDRAQQDKRTELQKKVTDKNNKDAASAAVKTVVIRDTATGWLRVRAEAAISAEEVAKVNPGDEFEVLEEKSGWYKIEYEKGKAGWVSSEFVTLRESSEEEEATPSAQ